jgi:hypothetical protein
VLNKRDAIIMLTCFSKLQSMYLIYVVTLYNIVHTENNEAGVTSERVILLAQNNG